MSYLHIENLYKDPRILAFRRCYATEKVHGTSAHISYKDGAVRFSSGGVSHEAVERLFDGLALEAAFRTLGHPGATVYGEAYGGACQGMKHVYGPNLRFIAFEIRIGDAWLAVPQAEEVARSLGLEFVPWTEGPTDLEWLNAQRDLPSVVAERRGTGVHAREGIVLRPPFEVTLNNGERLLAKHKGDAFAERQHPPKVLDPDAVKVLDDARAVADEWVTEMRLTHVLDKAFGATPLDMSQTGIVIRAMVEDVLREASGEIVDSRDVRKAIGQRAAVLFKARVASPVSDE